jgi:hypothetical protein
MDNLALSHGSDVANFIGPAFVGPPSGIMANQWTGNALSDGTAVTSGNVATVGNFTGTDVTWSRPGFVGTPTLVSSGDGMSITSSVSTDIARLDSVLATSIAALRTQFVFKAPSATSGLIESLAVRTTTTVAYVRYDGTSRVFTLRDANNTTDLDTSPAIAADDVIVIDLVAALNAAPTTTNSRLIYRLKNKTNPSWNTTGYRFYDSGYTINLGTINLTGVRWGKTGPGSGGGTMASGASWEFLGIQGVIVSTADTSEVAASAYFANDPVPVVSLYRPGIFIFGG